MAPQLDEDVSSVSHPQPEPGFKGKQTMEDVVTKVGTNSPPPTLEYVDNLDGNTSVAPPLDCSNHEYTFLVSPTCAANAPTLQSSTMQLFNMIKKLFIFRLPPLRSCMSTKTVCSVHPGNTWNSSQTCGRCHCCQQIIVRLEHELASSRAGHLQDYQSMKGENEMLKLNLLKASEDIVRQRKLLQEEIHLQKSSFGAHIQENRTEIQLLQSLNENLRGSLSVTSSNNEKLAWQIESLEQEKAKATSANGSYLESSATPQLLETAVQGVKDALASFSKELMSLMKLGNWDIPAWGRSLEPAVRFSRPINVKFAIQSYICQRLFLGFEREDFGMQTGEAQFLSFDRRQAEYFSQYKKLSSLQASELMNLDSATETPDLKDFNYYCHNHYMEIVPENIEISLFGNNDLRRALKQGNHPECELYKTYFRLSKVVWALHRLAFSFEPHAHVIRVGRGAKFDAVYMRSVVMDEECDEITGDLEGTLPAVGFMVLPGFRVSKCVVQSQVYLNMMDSLSTSCSS